MVLDQNLWKVKTPFVSLCLCFLLLLLLLILLGKSWVVASLPSRSVAQIATTQPRPRPITTGNRAQHRHNQQPRRSSKNREGPIDPMRCPGSSLPINQKASPTPGGRPGSYHAGSAPILGTIRISISDTRSGSCWVMVNLGTPMLLPIRLMGIELRLRELIRTRYWFLNFWIGFCVFLDQFVEKLPFCDLIWLYVNLGSFGFKVVFNS